MEGISILFSAVATTVFTHTNSAWGFIFSTFSPFVMSYLLIITFLTGMKWCLIVGLICISLMINDVDLVMYLLAIYTSLEKCLFRPSVHMLVWFFDFCYWALWIFHIFGILTPYHINDLHYFLPFSRLPFHFVNSFICYTEFFSSNSCTYLFFAFVTFVFGVRSKKSSPRLMSWSF